MLVLKNLGTIYSSNTAVTAAYTSVAVLGTDTTHNTTDNAIFDQLILYVGFLIGSLTDILVKVEASSDQVRWYAVSMLNTSTGAVSILPFKLAASGDYRIPVAIKDKYLRVSLLGEGTATNSQIRVDACLGRSVTDNQL